MLRINRVITYFPSFVNVSKFILSPGGGKIKIESRKIDIKATSRIEAKNDAYVSKGGEKKVNFIQSLNFYDLEFARVGLFKQLIVNFHACHELRIDNQIESVQRVCKECTKTCHND